MTTFLSRRRTESAFATKGRYGTSERSRDDRRDWRDAPEARPEEVRALLFDVFGTVVNWRASMIGHLAMFASRRGIAADWASVADDWRGLYQPMLAEVRSGRRNFVPLDVLHRESLLIVLNRHGIRGFAEREITALTECWHDLLPWPDSVDGLQRLGSRSRLVSLSNADVNMSINIARNAGFRWDLILGAEPVRTYKPCPEVYMHAATATGLRPQNMMMVAAHNRDLEAAADLGFRTAFICRKNEHGQNQTTDISPTRAWDIEAEDLVDLSQQLDDLSFQLRLDRTGAAAGGSTSNPVEGGVEAPARLSRIRAAAVVAVVAGGAGLGFGQGYRFGLERNPIADHADQLNIGPGLTAPAGSAPVSHAPTPQARTPHARTSHVGPQECDR